MKHYTFMLAILVLAMALVLPVYAGTNSAPVADFELDSTTAYVGHPVTFIDTSSGSPTYWHWRIISDSQTPRDFPPPYDYYDQNPVVTFDKNWVGLHATVVLTVSNADGTDTKIGEQRITVKEFPCIRNAETGAILSAPLTDFVGTNVHGVSPLIASFNDVSNTTNTTGYIWSYKLQPSGPWTEFSTSRNATHTFTTQGNYLIRMFSNSTEYPEIWITKPDYVLVYWADFTTTPQTNPTSFLFVTNTNIPTPDSVTWNFGDRTTATGNSVVHTYPLASATYTVMQSVSKNGEVVNTSHQITIGVPTPSPTPTPTITPTPTPTPTPIPLQANRTAGVFRPESGNWYLDYNLDGVVDHSVHFGTFGDVPVPADYNNDGVTDFAVFRPASGNWYFDYNRDGIVDQTMHFGKSGDIPVSGMFQ